MADYTYRDMKLYNGSPDKLTSRSRPLTLKHLRGHVKQSQFQCVEHARDALVWSGRAKPGDRLYTDDGGTHTVSELDAARYWRNPRAKDPVVVIQPEFEVDWVPDEDPERDWLEEWIDSSIEDDWFKCLECNEPIQDSVLGDGDDCPNCQTPGSLESCVALRIGHKGEPQPKDNPEDYVADREYYDTIEKAREAAWRDYGDRVEFYGCVVKATWEGLTGNASCWGFSFGPTSDYQGDEDYKRMEESSLKEEALANLMERLAQRAGLVLP